MYVFYNVSDYITILLGYHRCLVERAKRSTTEVLILTYCMH